MITYIEKGDIFTLTDVTSFAHGCNCAGAMGKGIALQFRNKYPEMYLEYKELCKNGEYIPGDVFDYDYGIGHIYNLATQLTWRTKAKLEYIEKSVTKIALPAIGAGLGGLEWNDVKDVLEKASANYPNIELYVVESYQSGNTISE